MKKTAILGLLICIIALLFLSTCISTKSGSAKDLDFYDFTYQDMIDYLDRGGDINAQDGFGNTMLHCFVDTVNEEAVTYLLSHWAFRDIKNKIQRTPIDYAGLYSTCMNGPARKLDIYKLLVGEEKYREDINRIKDSINMPYLSFAISKNQTEVAARLMETGADLNQKDNLKFNEPPVFYAVQYQNFEIFRKLIGSGADLYVCDNLGVSILHYCCGVATASCSGKYEKTGMVEYASLLIEKGFPVRAWDKNMWTPLHWSARNGLIDISALLIRNGANATEMTADNKTCFDLARDFKQTAWLAYFTDKKIEQLAPERKDGWRQLFSLYDKDGEYSKILTDFSIYENADTLSLAGSKEFIYFSGNTTHRINEVKAEYTKTNGNNQKIPVIKSAFTIATSSIAAAATLESGEDGYYMTFTRYCDKVFLKRMDKPEIQSWKMKNINPEEYLIPFEVLPVAAPRFFGPDPGSYSFSVMYMFDDKEMLSSSDNIVNGLKASREKLSGDGFKITFYLPDLTMTAHYAKDEKITKLYTDTYDYRE